VILRVLSGVQCEWGLPVPHIPQELGIPEQATPVSPAPVLAAKVENFLFNFAEPQCGQIVPSQWLERTKISLSRSHCPQ